MPDTKTTPFLDFNAPQDAPLLSSLSERLLQSSLTHPSYKMSDTDRADYLALLNGEQPTPLDPDKANGILDALWSIMVAFVDLGFPPVPVPVNANNASGVASTCGQVTAKPGGKCDRRGANALYSSHQPNRQGNKNAPAIRSAAEREES